MGTQAVLSVVDRQGKVKVKLVSGCNGFKVKDVKKKLKELMKSGHTIDYQTVYNTAYDCELGCDKCLIVMSPNIHIVPDFLEFLPEGYRKTFDQPEFNPRWDRGTADYTEVIKEK